MIRIIYSKTAEEASINAANVIAELLKNKPNAVLGLATGSSPLGMYKELIRRCQSGEISFKRVKTVNLDEYAGLSPEHEQSYAYFMNTNLFDHVDIDKRNTHLPSGLARDKSAECMRYDSVIAAMGGIDIQVLGIGHNGHIGFNEPCDFFSNGTGLIKLTESTIEANSRFFASKGEVPTCAFSMGIGQIMAADKIILLAMGKEKAEILYNALFGPVTPEVPASILQFFKGEVIVCADAQALSVVLHNQNGNRACRA